MLRKLYIIIILLLCIEWSFSYNHIDDASGRSLHKNGRYPKKTRKLGKNRLRKNLIHQKRSYVRSPVDFDVASFIQPDDELIEEEVAIRDYDKNRQRFSSNYDYDSLVDLTESNNKKKKKGPEYLNVATGNVPEGNLNQPLKRDDNNAKHNMALNSNLDELNIKYNNQVNEISKIIRKDDNQIPKKENLHHPSKKCAFKRIRIPFFSHKKPDTVTTKKPKKRKLFCFNCPKKESQSTKANITQDDVLLHYKLKRAPDKKLPQSKIKRHNNVDNVSNVRRKKTLRETPVIQQFYENHPSQTKFNLDLKNRKRYNFDNPGKVFYESSRNKREDPPLPDKARQLKELEEVQRKIDNVKVTIPHFYKLSQPGT